MKRGRIITTATIVGVLGLPAGQENTPRKIVTPDALCKPHDTTACELGSTVLATEVVTPLPQADAPVPPVASPTEITPPPTPPAEPTPPIPVPEVAPAPPADPTPPTEPKPTTLDHNRIYILGDSLTIGTSRGFLGKLSLESVLDNNGWNEIRVNAVCGRPLTSEETFKSCDAGEPMRLGPSAQIDKDEKFVNNAETILVALGTNDYAQDPGLFEKNARLIISKIQTLNPSARILWPNIYLARRGKSYTQINTVIRKLGIEPIDYASRIAPYYKVGVSDGVHPNRSGYIKRVQILSDRIGSPKP